MKDFLVYTVARLAVFGATFIVLWYVAGLFFISDRVLLLAVLLVAAIISSVISIFALSGLRDKVAQRIENRAKVLNEMIEESRRAEDVD